LSIEAAIIAISVLCIASAIYMAMLSTQVVDTGLKMKLVDWAIYCLVSGIVILMCWLITQSIKRAFTKKEESFSLLASQEKFEK